ncbi:MAG: hypothetical protein SFW66_08900 [Gammaproteobacteria bacterium]|nr:hypothetical protein [Gammaproteobacteria bacterium]
MPWFSQSNVSSSYLQDPKFMGIIKKDPNFISTLKALPSADARNEFLQESYQNFSSQSQQAQPSEESPVTQNKNFGVGGRVKKSGVSSIIENDLTPEVEFSDGGFSTPIESSGGLREKLLGGDVEGNKKFLGELGFKMPNKKSGILDSIISGLASIGSAAVGDRENAIGIRESLSQRQGIRQGEKSAFQNALLSLVTKDPRPNIVKEFEAFAAMDPAKQRAMENYLRVKANTDPLKQALSRMIQG